MGYLIGYHTSPQPQLIPFEPSALLRRRSSTPVIGYRYRCMSQKTNPIRVRLRSSWWRRSCEVTAAPPTKLRRGGCAAAAAVTSQLLR